MNKDIIEKLNQHIAGIGEVVEMLENEHTDVDTDDPTPWLTEALKWEGKHEVDDNAEIAAFIGQDPRIAWCAALANACYEACGIKGTGTPRALDFAEWGVESDESDGCLMVFATEIGGHVGWKVGDKLFGGNQSDMAKFSNLAWFKKNMTLVACRLPATVNPTTTT